MPIKLADKPNQTPGLLMSAARPTAGSTHWWLERTARTQSEQQHGLATADPRASQHLMHRKTHLGVLLLVHGDGHAQGEGGLRRVVAQLGGRVLGCTVHERVK